MLWPRCSARGAGCAVRVPLAAAEQRATAEEAETCC